MQSIENCHWFNYCNDYSIPAIDRNAGRMSCCDDEIWCVDGYFDSYVDIYHYCCTTATSVLCVYLSLRLAMLGKNSPKSPQSSIRMVSNQEIELDIISLPVNGTLDQ